VREQLRECHRDREKTIHSLKEHSIVFNAFPFRGTIAICVNAKPLSRSLRQVAWERTAYFFIPLYINE